MTGWKSFQKAGKRRSLKSNTFSRLLMIPYVALSILALVLLASPSALAQGGGNVAISGTVTDPSGAVIAGAKVTVTELSTSVARTETTTGAANSTFLRSPRRPTRSQWRRKDSKNMFKI